MDALRIAPSPFTAGVLSGAFVCLVALSPWPLAGCLILAAASHAKDAILAPPCVALTGSFVFSNEGGAVAPKDGDETGEFPVAPGIENY